MKNCNVCGLLLPFEDFNKHPTCKGKRQPICRLCVKTKHSYTRARKKNLKRRYSITEEQYNELFDSQCGKCAICGTHQKDLSTKLAVDHIHSTGVIRGLLCYNCNMGLGRFKDSEQLIISALSYLMSHTD